MDKSTLERFQALASLGYKIAVTEKHRFYGTGMDEAGTYEANCDVIVSPASNNYDSTTIACLRGDTIEELVRKTEARLRKRGCGSG